MTERFCPKSERRSRPKETNYCDRNMYLPLCHSQEQKAPIALYAWPQKLDHKLRCIMEQLTKPVEGQFDGQETAVTHAAYILDTFPIVRRHDKAAFGHYRTKAMILPHYNASPPAIPMSSYRSSPSSLSRERRIMPTDSNEKKNYTIPPSVDPYPEFLHLDDPSLPRVRIETFC